MSVTLMYQYTTAYNPHEQCFDSAEAVLRCLPHSPGSPLLLLRVQDAFRHAPAHAALGVIFHAAVCMLYTVPCSSMTTDGSAHCSITHQMKRLKWAAAKKNCEQLLLSQCEESSRLNCESCSTFKIATRILKIRLTTPFNENFKCFAVYYAKS